jgi:hypothetical protein
MRNNTKILNRKLPKRTTFSASVLILDHSIFGFASNFELRYSDFCEDQFVEWSSPAISIKKYGMGSEQ